VFQDVLGLQTHFKPKFARRYLEGAEIVRTALRRYVDDVRQQKFPAAEESFDVATSTPEVNA
jgi:3-methyl-2-oxobutanoate hydroxymethyltransferase